MNRNHDSEFSPFELHRRRLLRGVAASPVAAFALPVEADAASSVEVTVEQNGTEVATVAPVSTDRTVVDFYRYDRGDGASANTPTGLEKSDASRLFFYRQSGADNPLSVVVIHDAPNDGNGGNVRFDFRPSLPSGGSWAVEDDPGETFTRTHADWGWARCCTDGGAYRGGFGDGFEFTIDPTFSSGIGSWELLDGDGSVAATLAEAPITVTVGEPGPPDFDELADQKRQLARRVTRTSLSIGDVRLAADALEALEGSLEAGDITPETAREAVRRLKLGENVSETALVVPGPADAITPENRRTLVGSDDPRDFNIVDRFADLMVEMLAVIAVLAGSIAGGVAALLGGAAVSAVNELLAGILSFLKVISAGIDGLGDIIDSDTLDTFAEAIKSASEPRKVLASAILAPAKEKMRQSIRGMMEQERSYSLGPILEGFSGLVSGAESDEGDPEFGGSADAARTNSERAIGRIVDLTAAESRDFAETAMLTAVLDIAAGLAAIGSILFGFTAVIATALAAVSTLTKFFQATDTIETVERMTVVHSRAVEGVRIGEVVVDAQ